MEAQYKKPQRLNVPDDTPLFVLGGGAGKEERGLHPFISIVIDSVMMIFRAFPFWSIIAAILFVIMLVLAVGSGVWWLALPLIGMAWSAPGTQITGALITAAIWNQDVVDNVQFLHDRVTYITVPTTEEASAEIGATNGSLYADTISAAGNKTKFQWKVPTDFAALSSAVITVSPKASDGTFQYDLLSDYAKAGELITAGNESELNSTKALVTDTVAEIDASGVMASIEAGDYVGLALNYDSYSGADKNIYVIGLEIGYTKT